MDYNKQLYVAQKMGYKNIAQAFKEHGIRGFRQIAIDFYKDQKNKFNYTEGVDYPKGAKLFELNNYAVLPCGSLFSIKRQKMLNGVSTKVYGQLDIRFILNKQSFIKSILQGFYFTTHEYDSYEAYLYAKTNKKLATPALTKRSRLEQDIVRLKTSGYEAQQITAFLNIDLDLVTKTLNQWNIQP